MTLQTTTSEIEYAGQLGEDTFAYNFRVDNKTDMNVEINSVPVAQGDFTMTGLGAPNGGTVILNTPLVADATVLLYRAVPLTQEVDYQPFDAFPAETHEFALDKLTMITQQNAAEVTRSLRFPPGDTADPVIPDSSTRALKFLGFDSAGNVIVSAGTAAVSASAVDIDDVGGYYTGNEVESALQQLGPLLSLKRKVLIIGSWDMNNVATKGVFFGPSPSAISDIRSIQVVVYNDAETALNIFPSPSASTTDDEYASAVGTNIVLKRGLSGLFDNTDYQDTGINRGWIIIDYV